MCQAPSYEVSLASCNYANCARRPHAKVGQTVLVSNGSNGVLTHMALQRHAADEAFQMQQCQSAVVSKLV